MKRIIEIAETIEEIELLKSSWTQLQTHPSSDYHEYLWSIKEWDPHASPYVLFCKNESGGIESILVGVKEVSTFDIRFGYLNIYSPRVKKLTFIHEGLLGENCEDICNQFIIKICQALENNVADIAWFNHLRKESPLLKAAIKIPRRINKDNDLTFTRHWAMKLPASVNSFWENMSSKHRYWLKRLPKFLEKSYLGKVKYEYYTDIAQVEELCSVVESVARKTYQRALGVGYIDSAAMRSRIRRLAEMGQLRAYLCFIDNEPIAYWIGLIYSNTFFLAYTGYDPKWRNYEVGTITFIKMIEDLIQRDKGSVERIDFGLGDAGYKRRFGKESWEEASVFIFPSTFKGLKLKIAKTIIIKGKRGINSILKKFNLEQKIKTSWRKRKAEALISKEIDK